MNTLFPTLGIAGGPEGFCAAVWLPGYPCPNSVPDSQQATDFYTPATVAVQDGKAFVGNEAHCAARLWGLPSIEISWPAGLHETAADESLALIFKKLYHDAKAWSLSEQFRSVAVVLPDDTEPATAAVVLRAAKWAALPVGIIRQQAAEAVSPGDTADCSVTQRAALAAAVFAAEQTGSYFPLPFSILRLDGDLSVAMDNAAAWPLASAGTALPLRVRRGIETPSGLGVEIRLTICEHSGNSIRPICTAVSKPDFLCYDPKTGTANRVVEVTFQLSPAGAVQCTLVDAETRQWANCEVVWHMADWQRDRARAIALNEFQLVNTVRSMGGLPGRG